jgi:hypothetical protein
MVCATDLFAKLTINAMNLEKVVKRELKAFFVCNGGTIYLPDQRSASKTTHSPSVGKMSEIVAPVMLAPMDLQ